jgi:hypothetical protein
MDCRCGGCPGSPSALWGLAAGSDTIGRWMAHAIPGQRLHSENVPFDAEHMLERCRLFLLIAGGDGIYHRNGHRGSTHNADDPDHRHVSQLHWIGEGTALLLVWLAILAPPAYAALILCIRQMLRRESLSPASHSSPAPGQPGTATPWDRP